GQGSGKAGEHEGPEKYELGGTLDRATPGQRGDGERQRGEENEESSPLEEGGGERIGSCQRAADGEERGGSADILDSPAEIVQSLPPGALQRRARIARKEGGNPVPDRQTEGEEEHPFRQRALRPPGSGHEGRAPEQ